MTRVLFCVIPEKGHVNPYVGPAQRLQEKGVAVGFYASHDISEQLSRAGLTGFLGPREGPPAATLSRGSVFASRIQDAHWLRHWIKTLLIETVEEQIAPIRRIIATFRPDVVVVDPMMYAAVIAATHEGVPWAAVSNSLNPVLPTGLDSELLRTVDWLSVDRAALFARQGLDVAFRGCDALSPHLTIAFTTKGLTGHSVAGVEMVGPSLPDGNRGDEEPFPWDRLTPGLPLIYMSLGSQIYYQPAMFRTVMNAVTGRAVQLVLSVSNLLNSADLGSIPPNVVAARHVPQLAILPRAAVFITHGGANSVMEAIAFGVPLLISPLCNDQFHQVHFVERAGIGLAVDLRSAAAADVWEMLELLMSESAIRRRMAGVSATFDVDGAEEAARLIIELAEGNRPGQG